MLCCVFTWTIADIPADRVLSSGTKTVMNMARTEAMAAKPSENPTKSHNCAVLIKIVMLSKLQFELIHLGTFMKI